jgi:hypothetical protein
VQQVRRPDQGLALAKGGVARLQPLALDQIGDELLVVAGTVALDVGCGHLGEAMAARVVDQGALLGTDVLERDPDSAHEPGWIGVEVHCVRMRPLLGADPEIEGLERLRHPPVDVLEQGQHGGGGGDRPDAVGDHPGVLHPAFVAVRDGPVAAEHGSLGATHHPAGAALGAKQRLHVGDRTVDRLLVDARIDDQVAVALQRLAARPHGPGVQPALHGA